MKNYQIYQRVEQQVDSGDLSLQFKVWRLWKSLKESEVWKSPTISQFLQLVPFISYGKYSQSAENSVSSQKSNQKKNVLCATMRKMHNHSCDLLAWRRAEVSWGMRRSALGFSPTWRWGRLAGCRRLLCLWWSWQTNSSCSFYSCVLHANQLQEMAQEQRLYNLQLLRSLNVRRRHKKTSLRVWGLNLCIPA